MCKFTQIHYLSNFPPSNVNRDDTGRPKTVNVGGTNRLRIASQSEKRGWRVSDMFSNSFAGLMGKRTKLLGEEIFKMFIEGNVPVEVAKSRSKQIAGVFGKLKGAENTEGSDEQNTKKTKKSKSAKENGDTQDLSDLQIEQLVHISPEEWDKVINLVNVLIQENRDPSKEELKLLCIPKTAVDIALWGRMLASNPEFAVEAACQVSHWFSVHTCDVEDDYFTAVDDLNKGVGAGHLSESGFAAALFYGYVCIDNELLIENLGGDEELANKVLSCLLEVSCKIAPSGKQNSFASRVWASYVLVEKGDDQPRTLASAFLKPISGTNYGEDAVKALKNTIQSFDKVYEVTNVSRKEMSVFSGEGSLSELKSFIAQCDCKGTNNG